MDPIIISEGDVGGYYAATIAGVGLLAASYIWYLVRGASRNQDLQKEDPAHKGCTKMEAYLFSAEQEFVDVTIILHDREQDTHPYLLVQAEGESDVRVPYSDMIRLNISDNTTYRTPMSAFGVDYRDFSGEATLIFVRPGSSFTLTKAQADTIKGSYDTWAASSGKAPLVVNDESYKRPKRTLVRRSA